MPAFKVKGATGQAPTTSFFGPVPDKYNMLMPGHPQENPPRVTIDNAIAANLVSTWTIYNPTVWGGSNTASASFTAGQSAPDGTTNAAKMVESTLNDIHMVTAGWKFGGGLNGDFPQGGSSGGVFRTAVFAKAAERTRISLAFGANGTHSGGGYQNLAQGIRVIFDLAGGQIGQAAANFGSPSPTLWTAKASGIIPFGNGWYLCFFDATIGSHQQTESAVYCGIIIDSGSGTAAESTSYAGDGTSGVLLWRATHLPAQAWGMTGQPVFFDDFNDNTMAEFDRNNTQAPGFKWYYSGQWAGPGYRAIDGAVTPIPPNTFTVSGGAITLPQGNFGSGNTFYPLAPATWLGGNNVGGQLFYSPMITEEIVKWSTASNTAVPGEAGGHFFADASIGGQLLTANPAIGAIGNSWSPVETLHAIFSSTTMFIGPNMTAGAFNSPEWMQNPSNNQPTFGIWYNAVVYTANTKAVFDPFDGNLYQLISAPSVAGSAPHSDATHWSLYNPVPDGLPPAGNCISFDYTVYHNYQTMWLRTDPVYGPAHTLTFVDGVFGQYIGSYNRQQAPFCAEGLGDNLFLLASFNYAHICDRMAIYN